MDSCALLPTTLLHPHRLLFDDIDDFLSLEARRSQTLLGPIVWREHGLRLICAFVVRVARRDTTQLNLARSLLQLRCGPFAVVARLRQPLQVGHVRTSVCSRATCFRDRNLSVDARLPKVCNERPSESVQVVWAVDRSRCDEQTRCAISSQSVWFKTGFTVGQLAIDYW